MIELQDAARAGWIAAPTGLSYPPEPWFLGGVLTGTVFRVPSSALPSELRANIPADHVPLTLAGQLPIAVAFVHYAAGGVLTYEELLVAVPVRRGLRLRCSVVQIWVDSAISLTGGRALWNIPKQLAAFDGTRARDRVGATMRTQAGEVASLTADIRGTLVPGRWQLPLTTAQHLAGTDVVSTNCVIGRLRRTRASWSFGADGPLAWLRQARPLADLMIDDAIVAFGQQVTRP